jgi:hypothetical protein
MSCFIASVLLKWTYRQQIVVIFVWLSPGY